MGGENAAAEGSNNGNQTLQEKRLFFEYTWDISKLSDGVPSFLVWKADAVPGLGTRTRPRDQVDFKIDIWDYIDFNRWGVSDDACWQLIANDVDLLMVWGRHFGRIRLRAKNLTKWRVLWRARWANGPMSWKDGSTAGSYLTTMPDCSHITRWVLCLQRSSISEYAIILEVPSS